MLAAKVIADAGFPAVFCSGYGQAASALGRPDDGSLTLDVVAERARAMAVSVDVPVLVDADTGFDDPGTTARTLAEAGAAAIMLEDQVRDKRCGHVAGKSVVSAGEMLERLRAALDARPDHLAIIARTDALAPLGADEALRRGRLYAEAGADVVFVEAPESRSQLEAVASGLPCPAMANIIPGGRTPELSVAELADVGFRLIVFGLVDLMLAAAALRSGFRALAATGSVDAVRPALLGFDALNELTGLTSRP
jgi:2-methylisocitrate lyase-like PEP mutase family enzyme